MLAKIMHHCAFLIIAFSTCTLCIQNGKSVLGDKLESDYNFTPEARQSSFHESNVDNTGFIPSNGVGVRFPSTQQYHQFQTNNPNELPSFGYGNPYPNNQIANNNQGANPYNLDLNTGEHSTNANNHHNYPYRQQHPNAIASPGHRDSPNVPNVNDVYLSQEASSSPYQHLNYKNPNYPPQRHQPYVRRPTYAQSYGNYLYNGQPNYIRRPTPPPSPPLPPPASSYSPYQDGHFTPPYRNDLTAPSSSSLSSLSSLTSLLGGTTTYPSQYANQFGNFALPFGLGDGGSASANANPIGSLLNSFGAPFAGAENPLSMQIIRGLENIARNDDLQCVPKVLCQMLGSPTRRAQLPAFITSPVITRFISSLPSSSPALIFGRAALLGLSGGEYSCARTYSKCPQNEDDILYYLNNHRGGFFKFFSERETQPAADTQHQYSPPPASASSQQPSIFNFLTGLGSSSSSSSSYPTTTTTNTNQGSLNSFMSDAVTNGIGSLFGNIISGYLNGQTASRRSDEEEDDDDDDDEQHGEKDSDSNESTSTEDPDADEVEGRILNNKSNILAFAEPPSNPISFPLGGEGNDNYEAPQFETEFRFPSTPHRDVNTAADDNRTGKRVNFIDSTPRPAYGTRMVFPDRTGTGNLRFDNDEYFRVGKIINRPDYNRGYKKVDSYSYTTTTTTRRPSYYKDYTKSSYSSSADIYNRYASSNYRKDNYNQANKEDTTGNIYVTNGKGVIEYYINAKGRKVYV